MNAVKKAVRRVRGRDEVVEDLLARVNALEAAVEENRRLNQRLADVIDVVTELLVPAVDRDDKRLKDALANLGKTLDADAPRG